jgi:endoglucanase
MILKILPGKFDRFFNSISRGLFVDDSIQLLKTLTEAHGVSGYEGQIRGIVEKYLEPLGKTHKDRIGSLLVEKTGSQTNPRVMLAAHMDEIGFMVRYISEEGYIKFLPLGGWFDQVLLGQRVLIKASKGDVVGVIGVKPPHLLSAVERSKVVEKADMYIDIGSISRKEVEEAGVRVGDPVVPSSTFEVLNNGKSLLGKAFDDRVGVALIIDVLSEIDSSRHPNTVFGAATVMEEVGLRGATTSVEIAKPDIAIILEADIAGDVPGVKPEESSTKLGSGPAILFYDARMIPNLKLRDFVLNLAKENDIPLQSSAIAGGATDGGVIHLYKTGVPTVVIAVPARHIHSHSSIIHMDDYNHAKRLLKELLSKLDEETVSGFVN